MASQKFLPSADWRKEIQIVLQCETAGFFSQMGRVASAIEGLHIRKEAKSSIEASSRKTQTGDEKMYEFKFKGGAQKLDKAQYKFHAFIVDTQAGEHHLYGALKNGLVTQTDVVQRIYSSAVPVIKVFTATAGFGVPKEYFSYFVMLNPQSTKLIHIKPLGFKKLTINDAFNWGFTGQGRFMSKEEVRRFFGADSDTWKFYNRQSFLSRQRLSELVTIVPAQSLSEPVEVPVEQEETRLLRFD
jgi:hypothetical protein